ncbi:hypothetical protein MRX96_043182 [Rhipicephalus microplus]
MTSASRHLAAAFAGPLILLWWSLTEISAQGGGGVSLNLFFEENAVAHHTEPFKILRGNAPSLVVRRGFPFKIALSVPASNVAIILTLGDLVFVENDQARSFYVMQDRGYIYHGQAESPVPKEWYYGQVNSKDNNGVVQGKWNPPYSNGVHPYAWSSSSAILNQYIEMGGNTVNYGQCFTFASCPQYPKGTHLNVPSFDVYVAYAFTVLRALGIPSRVVTNFPSVHVDNGGQVVDIRFPYNGAKPHVGGSIWNYHVWNEGWMRRPDLPGSYSGWQVLDGTPQGLSLPMPMARHAKEELVKVKLQHEKSVPLGQPITAACIVLNNQEKPLTAQLTITVTSATYNNRFPRTISTKVHNISMPARGDQTFQVAAQPQDYIKKIYDEGMITIEANLKYSNELAYARSLITIQIPKLNIDVPTNTHLHRGYQVTHQSRNGEVHYNVSMKNPLAIPLTSCELAVELPGSTRFLRPTPAGSVQPYGVFFKSGSMVRTSTYTRELNAAFHCHEMPIMSGHRSL